MHRRAFTLLELLIVIGLLAVLAGLVWPMLGPQLESARLVESADRLRSLLYMGSAHARQNGRRVEIRFLTPVIAAQKDQEESAAGDEPAAIQVLIERDPLGSPGAFDAVLTDWSRWEAERNVRLSAVQVAEPLALSAGGAVAPSGQEQSKGDAPPSIVFGPDGRSLVGDVTITLVSNNRQRSYVVQLHATTGLAEIAPPPETGQE